MKMALVLLLCLGLCGCATTNTKPYHFDDPSDPAIRDKKSRELFKTNMDTWIGESETSLIASWGSSSMTSQNDSSSHICSSLFISLCNNSSYLRKSVDEGKKLILYYKSNDYMIGGRSTTQETSYSGMVGNTPYFGTATTEGPPTPVEVLHNMLAIVFVINTESKIEGWDSGGFSVSLPYVKPSKKIPPLLETGKQLSRN